MPDNPLLRGAPDNRLVSLTQPHEVRDWCQVFDCTEDELRAAVKAVGHRADEVQARIARDRLVRRVLGG